MGSDGAFGKKGLEWSVQHFADWMPFLTSNQWCLAQVFPLYQFPQASLIFPLGFWHVYLCNFATKNRIWNFISWCTIYIYCYFLWPYLCTIWGLYWSTFCWSLWTYIDSSRIFLADFEVSQAPGTWRGRSSGAPFFYPMVYYNILIY